MVANNFISHIIYLLRNVTPVAEALTRSLIFMSRLPRARSYADNTTRDSSSHFFFHLPLLLLLLLLLFTLSPSFLRLYFKQIKIPPAACAPRKKRSASPARRKTGEGGKPRLLRAQDFKINCKRPEFRAFPDLWANKFFFLYFSC